MMSHHKTVKNIQVVAADQWEQAEPENQPLKGQIWWRSGFPKCPTQSYAEEWNAEANQWEQWEHEDPENQQ